MNILQRLLGRSSNPVFQTLAKNSDPEGSRLGAGAWRGSISAIHELTPTPCTAASHTHCPLPQGPWHLSRSAISFSPRTTRGWLPVGPPQSEAPGTGADKTGHLKMASTPRFLLWSLLPEIFHLGKGNGLRRETLRTAGVLRPLLFAFPTSSFRSCFMDSHLVLWEPLMFFQ